VVGFSQKKMDYQEPSRKKNIGRYVCGRTGLRHSQNTKHIAQVDTRWFDHHSLLLFMCGYSYTFFCFIMWVFRVHDRCRDAYIWIEGREGKGTLHVMEGRGIVPGNIKSKWGGKYYSITARNCSGMV